MADWRSPQPQQQYYGGASGPQYGQPPGVIPTMQQQQPPSSIGAPPPHLTMQQQHLLQPQQAQPHGPQPGVGGGVGARVGGAPSQYGATYGQPQGPGGGVGGSYAHMGMQQQRVPGAGPQPTPQQQQPPPYHQLGQPQQMQQDMRGNMPPYGQLQQQQQMAGPQAQQPQPQIYPQGSPQMGMQPSLMMQQQQPQAQPQPYRPAQGAPYMGQQPPAQYPPQGPQYNQPQYTPQYQTGPQSQGTHLLQPPPQQNQAQLTSYMPPGQQPVSHLHPPVQQYSASGRGVGGVGGMNSLGLIQRPGPPANAMPITSYNPPGGLLAHSTPNPSQPSRFSSFNDIATATRHAQDFLSSKAAQFSHMQTNPSSGVRTADYAGVKRDDSWPIRRSTTSSITSSSPSSSRSSAPSPPPPRRSAAPPPARHTPSRRRSSRSRSRSRTRSRTRSRSRSRVRPHSKSRSRSHSPRRSSPGPKLKKEVVPPKRRDASIERDKDRKYSFKMPPYVLNKPVYTLLDLKTMFTSLYLVSDFTSLHANWVDTAHVDLLALDKAITFEIENVDVEEPPQLPPGTVHSGFIYNAKVFLMSGISYSTLAKPRKEGEFFGKMLHFLVGNKENSLMAFGGPWVAELDGGDPTQDDTLKQTAIRTVHETIGVDLSKCTQWLRFMEVRYSRSTCFSPDSGEITVIFLPSIIDIAQPEAVLKKEKPESDKKEVENLASVDPLLTSLDKPEVADHKSGASLDAKSNTTAPSSPAASSNSITTPPTSVATSSSASKDPVIVVKNKRPKHAKGTRTMCISLEGLLEYNESDVQECTFEVSLFGELFSMMLGRDFGALILEHMLKYSLTLPLPSDKEKSESKDKKSPVSVPDSSKRKRDTEMHPTEPPGKKPRVEGENGNTKPDTTDQVKKLKNDDVNTQENGTAHTTKEVDSGQLQTGEQATGVTNNQLTVPSSNKDTDLGPLSKEKPKPKGLEPVKKSDTSVEQKAPLKQEGKSDILSKNVNRELVRAFQYFDRSSVGFLRPYDIEAMIHCLGYQMSKRDVQTLVSRVVDHHYTHHQLLLQNIVSNQSASINITLPSQQQSVMRVPEWCRHKLYYIKFAEVVGSSHISNSQSSQVNAVPSPEHPVHSSMNLNQGPLVTQNNPPTHDNSVTGMPCESDVTMDSNKAAESTDTSSTEQSTTGQQEFQNNNTTASETTAATTSEQVSAESNVLLIEEAAEVPTEGGVQYQDQEQYADQQQYQEQQDPEQQQQLMSSDAQQVQEQGDQDGYTEEQTYQPVDTDQQAGDQDGTIEHYEDLVDGGGTTEEAPSENQDKGPDVGAE